MVKIIQTSKLTDYEKRKLKNEDDSLIIGKEDRTISLMSAGDLIDIKELATFIRPGNQFGHIKFQTSDRSGFMVQYGLGSISTNSTEIVALNTPFINRPFQVLITPRGSTMVDSTYTISNITNTNFEVVTKGGEYSTFNFYWFAIGF